MLKISYNNNCILKSYPFDFAKTNMSMLLFFLGTIFVGSGLSVACSGNGNCASNLGKTFLFTY